MRERIIGAGSGFNTEIDGLKDGISMALGMLDDVGDRFTQQTERFTTVDPGWHASQRQPGSA